MSEQQKAKRAKNAFVYSTIICLVSTFVMALFSIGVVIYFNQKWCAIVEVMDDTWDANPPTTPAGVELAKGIKNIRNDFFC